jgi:hypothetical protein
LARLQQFAERMETQALESMSKNGQEVSVTT